MAAYTRCLRCAGAPRRPASGSGLSLSILSWHTVLSDPGEFDHRQFQRSDVDAAFAESRPARHSQDSRNPFRAGDDFRGFLVRTSATVCQFARPLHGSDRLPSQRGFYIQASSGLVALPAAGYNYNSDWTPLLAGLSPARMAASLAALDPYGRLSRIRLPPRVCDGKAIAWPRMKYDRFGKPELRQLGHPRPRDPIRLAAPPERAPP